MVNGEGVHLGSVDEIDWCRGFDVLVAIDSDGCVELSFLTAGTFFDRDMMGGF